MIGGTGKEQRRVGCSLDQFLWRGDDLDDCRSFFGQQSIATVQMIAAFEEDAGFASRCKGHLQSAALAFVVDEGDRVGSGEGSSLVEY